MSSERIITEEKQFDCHCEAHSHEGAAAVQATMPNEDLLYDLADFFKVLGDSTRVRILMALDVSELCVCDLADALSMTKSAVSHQLSKMRGCSMITCEKRGKEVYYRLDDHHVSTIFELSLTHICHRKEEEA